MKNIFFSLLFICSLGAVAQIDRSTQPKPGPAPEINLSEPETFTLKNGLKVIVVENHKLPRVSYTLTLDNPPIAEGEKTGAAALSGALLGKGSANISKDDFNEEVDYIGARMNFGSQYASAGGLSQYAERILELLADAAIPLLPPHAPYQPRSCLYLPTQTPAQAPRYQVAHPGR